jgi:hypothetical protein
MTASIPIYAPLVERVDAGEDLPPEVRREHALGLPEDCAPLVVYLASEAGAGVTGQAIGIGGDKLTMYSHPDEAAAEYHDGGWSTEAIADALDGTLGDAKQRYGITLPALELS